MAENTTAYKQAKVSHRSIDFMTIPQLKEAKKILEKKLDETKDPLIRNKLQSRLNDYTDKERKINRFYEKCMHSKNPNLSSMMRGRRLLLKFVDVKRVTKNGQLKDMAFKSKKEKADYNVADFLHDVRADKIACGLGVATMALGAASIRVGNKSLFNMIMEALKTFVKANPLSFGLLAGGISLIAASKIIPSINKTVRRVKNHASAVRQIENQIADERFKDESGFDYSALNAGNFENSKDKIVNDLTNHPALLLHYKNELSNPNSKLTSGQKLNLLKALQEVNYKLDDLERLKRGEPTKAEEAEHNRQKTQDEQNYNQAKDSIYEIKNAMASLNSDTKMTTINALGSKIKNVQNIISQIKDNNLSSELLPEINELENNFNVKSSEIIKAKEEKESALSNEIENDIKSVTEKISKANKDTPIAEINGISSALKEIQNKINGLELDKFKTKLQDSLNNANSQYAKISPEASRTPTPQENKENEENDSKDYDLKTEIEESISKQTKAINKLSSKSVKGDFDAIANEIVSLQNKFNEIASAEIKAEVEPQINALIDSFNQKKDEINKHLDNSSTNDNLSKEISKKLEDFSNTIDTLTLQNLEGAKNTLQGILDEINKIEDPSVKENLTNNYNSIKVKLDSKEQSLQVEQEVSNLDIELNGIENAIANMKYENGNKKEIISVSMLLEKIEPQIYKTKDNALIQRYVNLDNAYISKRNELLGQQHDGALDEINNEISRIRMDVININEHNFNEVRGPIEKSMQDLYAMIQNVPTTKTHFISRYENLKKDFEFEVGRQNRKAQNKEMHNEIDSFDVFMSNVSQKLLTIPEFKKEYDAILKKIDGLQAKIKQINENNARNGITNNSPKHVEARLNECVANLKKLVAEYEKVIAKNEEITRTVENTFSELEKEYHRIDFSNKDACEKYIAKLCGLRDKIGTIEMDPELKNQFNTKYLSVEERFNSRLPKEFKNESLGQEVLDEITNIKSIIASTSDYTMETYNKIKSDLDALKPKVDKVPITFLDVEYLDAYDKLNDAATKSILKQNEELVNNINDRISETHTMIGAMKEPSGASSIRTQISNIQTEINKLPLGKEQFQVRLNGLNTYLEKRIVKVSEQNFVNIAKEHFEKMESYTSRLNIYNFEQFTISMKERSSEVENLISSNKITDPVLIQRFKDIKERYNKKHQEVQKEVEKNNLENDEHIREIHEIMPEIYENIGKLNTSNYTTLSPIISDGIRKVGDLMAHICGNKELKSQAKNILENLNTRFSEVSKHVESEIDKENIARQNTLNLNRQVSEIENEIVTLTNPTNQDIEKIQDKIQNISKWSEQGISAKQISEATSKLQGLLDSKKALIKKEEELKESIENANIPIKNIEKQYKKIDHLAKQATDKKLLKELSQGNGVSKHVTALEVEVEDFLQNLETVKSSLTPEQYNTYKTNAISKKAIVTEKARAIKEQVMASSKINQIKNDLTTVNKGIDSLNLSNFVANGKVLSQIIEKCEKGAESLNNPEINGLIASAKSRLNEKIEICKQQDKERRTQERNSRRENTYESMLREATQNIVDQEGYRSARIQSNSERVQSSSIVRARIQEKLLISESETENYINPETGEIIAHDVDKAILRPGRDPEYDALVANFKQNIAVYNKVCEKEEATNIKVLESTLDNTKQRLIHRIAKVTGMSIEDASKAVQDNFLLTGPASIDSKVANDNQISNLIKKARSISETLNKYKSSNRTGRQKLTTEAIKISIDELNRIKRNMTSNLGKEQADALFNKVCAELNIKPEELESLLQNHAAPVNEAEEMEAPPTQTYDSQEVKQDPIQEKPDEELENTLNRDDNNSTPPMSLEEYEKKLTILYRDKREKGDAESNNAYISLYNEMKKYYTIEECQAVKERATKEYSTTKREKNDEKEINHTIKTLDDIKELIDEKLNAMKRVLLNGKPTSQKAVDHITFQINQDLQTCEKLNIEGFDAYKQEVFAEITKIKTTTKPAVQKTEPEQPTETKKEIANLEDKPKFSYEEMLNDLKEALVEYRKCKEAKDFEGMKSNKELVTLCSDYIRKYYPKADFAFEKEDVYKEIMLGEKVSEESKVKNLKDALSNVNTKSPKFITFTKVYNSLYSRMKTDPEAVDKLKELLSKIKNDDKQFKLTEKELYIAQKMTEIAISAAEKAKNSPNKQNNDIIEKETIIGLYKEGLTPEDIAKMNSKFNIKMIEEIINKYEQSKKTPAKTTGKKSQNKKVEQILAEQGRQL